MTRKLLLTTLAIAGAAASQAAVIFYEDFSGSNFVVGSSVQGVASNSPGAIGQAGAWAIQTTSGASATATVQTSALSYQAGNVSMSATRQITAASTDNGQNIGIGVDLSTALKPADVGNGNSIFVSALYSYTGNISSDRTGFGLLSSSISNNNNTSYFGVGTSNTSANFGSAYSAGNPAPPDPGIAAVSSTPYLLVMQLTSNGSQWNALNMWVNPESTDFGDDTAYMTTTGISTSTLGAVYIRGVSLDAGESFSVGAIRVGETWGDVVTAIPEPSTYAALAGLLALGVVAYRRRRA
jgi:hypothetical protein